jgi:signal transduction histidine kinase/ActR/RegA family two-component response regulator/HAMP domain-containing protein
MSLPRLSARDRIFIGFAVVAVAVAVQVAVAVTGLGRIRDVRARLNHVIQPRIIAADALERALLFRATAFAHLVATGSERHRDAYDQAVAASRQAFAELQSASTDAASTARADRMGARWRTLDVARQEALEVARAAGPRQSLVQTEEALSNARDWVLQEVHAYAGDARAEQDVLRAETATAQIRVRRAVLACAAIVVATLLVTAVVTTWAVRRPAQRLVRAARALVAGDFAPEIALGRAARPSGGDELEELTEQFGRMAVTLRRREDRLAAEGRVTEVLASSYELERVAAGALEELAAFTGAELAAAYLADAGTGHLRRVAGRFADATSETLPPDGLVGLALAQGRAVVVRDLPPDAPFQLRLGVGSLPPRVVLACPFTTKDGPAGVLVVAAARELPDDALPFVERTAAQLGIAAQKALAHARRSELATQLERANGLLQAHNEELQVHREQLQSQTEELQSQTEELQAQTEELQSQTEELQAQGEQLHAQSEEIHRQNDELRGSKDALDRHARALEDVDTRRGEFLATLGHELRNPLAAIATAAHLMEAAQVDGVSRHAAIVTRQSKQLRRLVDDLLDVARVNHGKIQLQVEPIDLRHAIEQAIEATRPALEAKSHRFAVSLPETALPVAADAARLQQVVSNLLHNAAKYTPRGGLVEVRAERAGSAVELCVRDSGVGIAQDLLPRIFEPFTQGQHADRQGLGLGLSLVKRLVTMHGGAVEARSDGPGRGSEFRVRLSARDDAPVRLRASRVASVPGGGPLRVLVVDDSVDLGETMTELLQTFGHDAVYADGAPAALERLGTEAFDVALLDIGLPEMDGHALAKEIRARLSRRAPRLVAVTGYAQPEDRARALEAGFELHLPKPVNPEELRGILAGMSADPERARRQRATDLRLA